MWLNWEVWVHGLVGAFLGGGASAVLGMGIKPEVFNFGSGLHDLGKLFLGSGLINACLYLKQSPVPAIRQKMEDAKAMLGVVGLVGLAALMLASSGCVQVPTSEIRFGSARARLPKDLVADLVEVTLVNGTNQLVFRAHKISTKNNPEVINASTAQIETAIRATGDVAANLAGQALKAAAK